ncbi:uncharacterized protein BYT42DRAFT_556185 [Radiomyces spectabilis]|uniref:uncharacterized protein n=1 Tax=Radiomyces spectabilis TaxID=64574 RepID=UPI0022208A09|nr:uncharacterized protein BYT42DRAFT_556185 [Radiomyces spectabilis]KAI8391254.1 hypothetical protein BYT42DRAFT_556185 [Radiomyces spectabilis]
MDTVNVVNYTFSSSSSDRESLFRRQAKAITRRAPLPYGHIPARHMRRHKRSTTHDIHDLNMDTKRPSSKAPYPFSSKLSLSPPSSFLSLLANLLSFSQRDVPSSPVGFMPRSSHESKVSMSPFEVIAPMSTPIDCCGYDNSDLYQDNCSCLSTSNSSTSSCGSLSSVSTCSSCATNSSANWGFSDAETSIRNHVRNHPHHGSISTAALSDILCEHYVQTQTMAMTGDTDFNSLLEENNEHVIDVPLETFRMFEAPLNHDEDTKSIWLNLQTTRDWTPIDVSSKEAVADEDAKVPIGEHATPHPSPVIHVERTPNHRARDTRVNAAHLRMIVAEVNMMRANKIIGPLRPRGYLPKRQHRFVTNQPSRLKYQDPHLSSVNC